MRSSTRTGALAAAGVAATLLLSACGPASDSGTAAAADDGSFSMFIGEPENPLVPGNTTEDQGNQVISSLWTGLVQYDETGGVAYTGVADSIASDDSTTWTVKLKDGWTFHDGTPVTAASFVDAWNYTAYSPNAQAASYFFANVAGYGDLQAPTDDQDEPTGDPAATEMTGLAVVDDQTFTVTLDAPFAQWPVTVGYSAFYPLPESFFDDPEAAGEKPVGNGPFQAEKAFEPGVGITLTRYDEYSGEDTAEASSVEYRVYTDVATAYTDVLAGNLDVVRRIPADASASAPTEFGDRYLEDTSSSFTYLGLPLYDPRFEDKRVRQALSMGIDRAAIATAIFNGTRTPATSVIAPMIDGARENACTYCRLDVAAANELLDAADFDRDEPIDLWFNAGAGQDAWMEAVGNQLRQNLGVDFVLKGDLAIPEYMPLAMQQGFTGPFRSGWTMDYPSPQNYLEPLYSTGALIPNGANLAHYSNGVFDQLVEEGNQARSNAAAIEKYNQAEDVLLEDMPIIPMFFQVEQSVFSEHVSDVKVDMFGRVEAAEVTVND
ncbi:ABC transporter substrate-binding protein [Blastococcus sp. CT_GayMR16]|uniref:peptide ABC transporter substrate-binding protein n=1 Tax=Blastococcus sp. CT_GayMR16 TaxID=2559607 RepID=UPI00107328F1|nr:ABC transporter substrate-binding protein [Blastococcus sp. CT_GayMR16]TFV89985.1 ABC transporter substrate-binding protein [Blastococcus sp. CT_GayMR16]